MSVRWLLQFTTKTSTTASNTCKSGFHLPPRQTNCSRCGANLLTIVMLSNLHSPLHHNFHYKFNHHSPRLLCRPYHETVKTKLGCTSGVKKALPQCEKTIFLCYSACSGRPVIWFFTLNSQPLNNGFLPRKICI